MNTEARRTHKTQTDLVPLNSLDLGVVWASVYGKSPVKPEIERVWAQERSERPTMELPTLGSLGL